MTQKTSDKPEREAGVQLSAKVYEFLVVFVQIISPSASAMYLGLSAVFDWPYASLVVICTLTITTCIGVFLMFTTKACVVSLIHYDGNMLVQEGESGELLYSLELNDDPEPLRLKSHIIFNVIHEQKHLPSNVKMGVDLEGA